MDRMQSVRSSSIFLQLVGAALRFSRWNESFQVYDRKMLPSLQLSNRASKTHQPTFQRWRDCRGCLMIQQCWRWVRNSSYLTLNVLFTYNASLFRIRILNKIYWVIWWVSKWWSLTLYSRPLKRHSMPLLIDSSLVIISHVKKNFDFQKNLSN